jgi:hypothetical protein
MCESAIQAILIYLLEPEPEVLHKSKESSNTGHCDFLVDSAHWWVLGHVFSGETKDILGHFAGD